MQVKTKQKLFGALAHLVNSVETSMTAITSYERAVAYGRRARKFCVTLALLEYQYCKDDFWKCLAACAQQTAPLSSSIAAMKCYWKSEWSEKTKSRVNNRGIWQYWKGFANIFGAYIRVYATVQCVNYWWWSALNVPKSVATHEMFRKFNQSEVMQL